MQETAEMPKPQEPERSRAVFSLQDFDLIRTAIAHYMQQPQTEQDRIKYANLYHRLGRVA